MAALANLTSQLSSSGLTTFRYFESFSSFIALLAISATFSLRLSLLLSYMNYKLKY